MPVMVKICGLTTHKDAQFAVNAGADLLGFIFYPQSSRYVSPETARKIISNVDIGNKKIQTVGIFVNEVQETIAQILDYCGLQLAQLHGEEPPEVLGISSEKQSNKLLKLRAYKAIRPKSMTEALSLADKYALPASYTHQQRLPAILLDAFHPNLRGGTGMTGSWEIAARVANQYPIFLAGGLTPSNIRLAIHAVKPWGVDVASGVESSPGHKDHNALQAFITAAKSSSSSCPIAEGI